VAEGQRRRSAKPLFPGSNPGAASFVYETLLDFDRVLGLSFEDVRRARTELPDKVRKLIAEREKARRARDWAKADVLRARIGELGYYILEDTPHGVRWKSK
jgi:cysteinyl-tRNA synthetase